MPALTKRAVDALRPRAREFTLWDSTVPGFGVRVWPSGKKVFVYMYRPAGGRGVNAKRITLGEFGALTVEMARTLAKARAGAVATGLDPAGEREARRRAMRAEREALTVAELGADYLDDVDARRKPTTAREYRRLWTKHVIPVLGSMKVADVTTANVAVLHRTLKSTPYVANRVLAVIAAFFTHAEQQGLRPKRSNPASDVRDFPESRRERYLTTAELKKLGDALTLAETRGLPPWRDRKRATAKTAKHRTKKFGKLEPANPFAVAAVRFLLLTGWRLREALTLRWSDVDLEAQRAVLSDTKTGRSVRLIGAPAVELLSTLPRMAGSPYVFPGVEPGKPLSTINATWFAVRHAAGIEDVRLHDLRHSYASEAASMGVGPLVLRNLLGHRNVTTTERYAHLYDDPVKRGADEVSSSFARKLAGKPGTSVTPLRARAAD